MTDELMSYEDDKKRKQRETTRRWREANPDKVLAMDRRYKKANREKIAEKSRLYREANPDKVKESNRKYREANPEKRAETERRYKQANREKVAETFRLWYKENPPNPEKRAEANRRYRQAHPEKRAETVRRYRQENPEKVKAISRRRRTRVVGAVGSHTEAEWQALKSYYMDQCLCCGDVPDKMERDHIVPLARGGTDNISNIQPLCRGCNASKGARTVDYRLDTDQATVASRRKR